METVIEAIPLEVREYVQYENLDTSSFNDLYTTAIASGADEDRAKLFALFASISTTEVRPEMMDFWRSAHFIRISEQTTLSIELIVDVTLALAFRRSLAFTSSDDTIKKRATLFMQLLSKELDWIPVAERLIGQRTVGTLFPKQPHCTDLVIYIPNTHKYEEVKRDNCYNPKITFIDGDSSPEIQKCLFGGIYVWNIKKIKKHDIFKYSYKAVLLEENDLKAIDYPFTVGTSVHTSATLPDVDVVLTHGVFANFLLNAFSSRKFDTIRFPNAYFYPNGICIKKKYSEPNERLSVTTYSSFNKRINPFPCPDLNGDSYVLEPEYLNLNKAEGIPVKVRGNAPMLYGCYFENPNQDLEVFNRIDFPARVSVMPQFEGVNVDITVFLTSNEYYDPMLRLFKKRTTTNGGLCIIGNRDKMFDPKIDEKFMKTVIDAQSVLEYLVFLAKKPTAENYHGTVFHFAIVFNPDEHFLIRPRGEVTLYGYTRFNESQKYFSINADEIPRVNSCNLLHRSVCYDAEQLLKQLILIKNFYTERENKGIIIEINDYVNFKQFYFRSDNSLYHMVSKMKKIILYGPKVLADSRRFLYNFDRQFKVSPSEFNRMQQELAQQVIEVRHNSANMEEFQSNLQSLQLLTQNYNCARLPRGLRPITIADLANGIF